MKKFYLFILLSLLLLLTGYANQLPVVKYNPNDNPVLRDNPDDDDKMMPDAIKQLKKTFLLSLMSASKTSRERILHKVPLIASPSPFEMRLLLPDHPAEPFRIDTKTISFISEISHIPLTVYNLFVMNGSGKISETPQKLLQKYMTNLDNTEKIIQQSYFPLETSKALMAIVQKTQTYMKKVMSDNSISFPSYEDYVFQLQPEISKATEIATRDQLTQFYDQMKLWQQKYKNENWKDLHVVLMGYHAFRNKYSLTTFFKWLERETNSHYTIDFMEFTFPIKSNEDMAIQQAINTSLLIEYLTQPANFMLQNNKGLKKDIMGDAALKIIRQWNKHSPALSFKHKISQAKNVK